ncbi:MAG: hypothetical protein U0893_13270 [Chloroflexota bacterium]
MRASFFAVLLLLVSTGCAMLNPSGSSSSEQTYSVDPSQPFVVVTVGGSPVATPTSGGVAETVPESTPLPRIVLPTPDPANAPTPRPVASPSLSRGGQASAQAAAQAQRGAANPAAASSPAAAARTP